MEAIVFDTDKEPEDLTPEEYAQLSAVLKQNVENGMIDPLINLDAVSHQNLTRLAFHADINFDNLEGEIRNAIRERGDGEPAARRFTLRRYRAYAKRLKTQLAEAATLRAKLAARNLRVTEGGKSDKEATDIEREAGGDTRLQAKLFSEGAILKALGILESRYRGRVWYDDFYNQPFTDWDGSDDDKVIAQRPVDDVFLLSVMVTLQLHDTKLAKGLSLSATEQALQHFADTDHRHEPRDWLKRLEWDGKPRLSSWLSTVYGVDDARYHQDVGRCWITSMVARIMKAGEKVHTMPVLIGPQGNRKSTSLEILGGKWYATINISVDKQQDFLMSLNGLLVAEVAELDAISRAADSRVKTMLSTATDKFRPPYGRVVKEFERTAVLVGSTNDMSWHKDNTGGRRYWPIQCQGAINVQWLHEHREQLFAEAKVLYDGGASWWDVDATEQAERVAMHHMSDPWVERIGDWISSRAGELWTGEDSDSKRLLPDLTAAEEGAYWGTVVTTSRIMTQVLSLPIERQNGVTKRKVTEAMRQLGFYTKKVRGDGAGRAGRPKDVWCVRQVELGDEQPDGQRLLPWQEQEPE